MMLLKENKIRKKKKEKGNNTILNKSKILYKYNIYQRGGEGGINFRSSVICIFNLRNYPR